MPHRADDAREPRVQIAYRIMQRVFASSQCIGKTERQIDRAIQAAYPWGERRGWPYKAWLLARREFYETHGLPIKARRPIAESVQESEA